MSRNPVHLAEKIQALSSEQIAEVEAFVEFLQSRSQERALAHAAAGVNEPAFERVWSNPEDDVYDAL
jgi:hypothetical protein